MLKKGFVLALIILLVGIGVFSLIHLFPTDNNDTKNTLPSQEEKASNTAEESDEQTQEEEAEEPTITKKFSDLITDAVQNTIDFFANKETHVVAIGDSLTEGVGDSTGEGGYIGILDGMVNEKKHVATFDNFGKRGNRTDQLLERMKQPEIETALADADIILITIGANDIMQIVKENITNLEIDEFKQERVYYEERLGSIFDDLEAINDDAAIYLLGFYNPFKRALAIKELDTIVDEWNRTGASVARVYDQITFIPTKDLFDDADEEEELLAGDNFHPNYYGYQRMADRVLEYVTE